MKKIYLIYSIITIIAALFFAFNLSSDLLNTLNLNLTSSGQLFSIINDFTIGLFGDNTFGLFASYLIYFQMIYLFIFGLIGGMFKLSGKVSRL